MMSTKQYVKKIWCGSVGAQPSGPVSGLAGRLTRALSLDASKVASVTAQSAEDRHGFACKTGASGYPKTSAQPGNGSRTIHQSQV